MLFAIFVQRPLNVREVWRVLFSVCMSNELGALCSDLQMYKSSEECYLLFVWQTDYDFCTTTFKCTQVLESVMYSFVQRPSNVQKFWRVLFTACMVNGIGALNEVL